MFVVMVLANNAKSHANTLRVRRALYQGGLYVTEENIKKIVKRYKLLSSFWLFVFLIIALLANWVLIDSNIRNHSELGLDYHSSHDGFIWGAIIVGLNVVLQLFFYSLEKILLFLQQESSSSN